MQQPVSKKHKRHSAHAVMQPASSVQHASLPAQIQTGLIAQQQSSEAAAVDGTPRERKKKRKARSEQGPQPAQLLSAPGMSAEAKAEAGVCENGPGAAARNAAAPALVKTEPGSLDGKPSRKQKRKLELSTPDVDRAGAGPVSEQEPGPSSATQLLPAGPGSQVGKPSKKQRRKLGLSTPDLIGTDTAVVPKQELRADSAAGTRSAGVLGSGPAKQPKRKSRLGISTPQQSGMNSTAVLEQEPALGSTTAAGMPDGKSAEKPRRKMKSGVNALDSSQSAGMSSSMPSGVKLEAPEQSARSVKPEAAPLLAGNGAAVKSEGGLRKPKKRKRISDTEHRTAEHALPNGHYQPQQHAHVSDGTGLPASSSKQHQRSSKKALHPAHIQLSEI